MAVAGSAVVRSTSPDDLPFTGLDADRLVPAGAFLLLLGAGMVTVAAVRRRTDSHLR